jgi:hypothetical protein
MYLDIMQRRSITLLVLSSLSYWLLCRFWKRLEEDVTVLRGGCFMEVAGGEKVVKAEIVLINKLDKYTCKVVP